MGRLYLALLGLLLTLPGLILFMNAETRWVDAGQTLVFSMCVFVLAAACIVFAIRWQFGKTTGRVSGAVILVGLVVLALDGRETIHQRAKYRADRAALADSVEKLCAGKNGAHPRAASYETNLGARNVIEIQSKTESGITGSYKSSDFPWKSPVLIGDVGLAGCMVTTEIAIGECEYQGVEGGRILKRVRVDVALQLYAVKTGDLVFKTVLEGGQPRDCKWEESFLGDEGNGLLKGSMASPEAITEVLTPFVDF